MYLFVKRRIAIENDAIFRSSGMGNCTVTWNEIRISFTFLWRFETHIETPVRIKRHQVSRSRQSYLSYKTFQSYFNNDIFYLLLDVRINYDKVFSSLQNNSVSQIRNSELVKPITRTQNFIS